MPQNDDILKLLTEIRDLQKEQTDIIRTAEHALLHTEKLQKRNLVLRIVFYGFCLIFTAFATYFYYHTLVTSLGGL